MKGKLNSEKIWKIWKISVLVIITPEETSSSSSTSAAILLILLRRHCHPRPPPRHYKNVEIPPKTRYKQKQNETHENITH